MTCSVLSQIVLNSYYESFVFRHNGAESPYQQDMENILTDIMIASENDKDYITVDENADEKV